jgi:hypothetical protein
MMVRPAALALLLLLSPMLAARTLVVRTDGHDHGDGSERAPFRTITHAARVARPGDRVEVRGGTYFEGVSISSRGTAAARIVIAPRRGELVVLDGSRLSRSQSIVALTHAAFVDVSGFEVRNAPYIGIAVWGSRNIRILENEVHHAQRNGIYAGADRLSGNRNLEMTANHVHDTVLENRRHDMPFGGWAGALVVSETSNAIVTRNRVRNNHGEGVIALLSNHVEIRENEIFDNFSANLYLDNARFVTADGNLLYATGDERYFREGRSAAGIAVANERHDLKNLSSNNVFSNNVVRGTRWGFYYGAYERGGGLRNTRVVKNTFSGIVEDIVHIESDRHTGSEIAGNSFCDSPGKNDPQSLVAPRGVTIHDNWWCDAASKKSSPGISGGHAASVPHGTR